MVGIDVGVWLGRDVEVVVGIDVGSRLGRDVEVVVGIDVGTRLGRGVEVGAEVLLLEPDSLRMSPLGDGLLGFGGSTRDIRRA